jgi:hypothetical protein
MAGPWPRRWWRCSSPAHAPASQHGILPILVVLTTKRTSQHFTIKYTGYARAGCRGFRRRAISAPHSLTDGSTVTVRSRSTPDQVQGPVDDTAASGAATITRWAQGRQVSARTSSSRSRWRPCISRRRRRPTLREAARRADKLPRLSAGVYLEDEHIPALCSAHGRLVRRVRVEDVAAVRQSRHS